MHSAVETGPGLLTGQCPPYRPRGDSSYHKHAEQSDSHTLGEIIKVRYTVIEKGVRMILYLQQNRREWRGAK